MKILFINKLLPTFKDNVLAQEPNSLNVVTNTARAMWKRTTNAMNPITIEIEDSFNNLPDDIREECIMAIQTNRTSISTITAIRTHKISKIHQTIDKYKRARRRTNHQTMRL
jgi:hypothetical protein